jgi:hypothetical protein
MKLDKIFSLNIKEFEYDAGSATARFNFRLLEVGRNIDGIIFWQDVTNEDFEEFKNIIPDM